MTNKLVLINTLVALILSFSGLIAFNSGLFQETVVDDSCVVTDNVDLETRNSRMTDILLNPRGLAPLSPEQIDRETLWLARAIYSETKRPEEQVLVAWVIRNRVETGFRGKRSYESVVLDPFQFSAFLPTSEKRNHYMSLNSSSREPGWRTAMAIAYAVRHMDDTRRPFAIDTRHFYSQQSMVDRMHPGWADDGEPVELRFEDFTVDDRRFRFLRGVS